MKECPHCHELIEKLIAGELSSPEWESLRRHAEECVDCRQVLEVHQELSRVGGEIMEPDDAEFRVMRMNIMNRVSRRGGRPWWQTFWQDARIFLRAQPTGALLLVAAIVTGSVWTGHQSAGPPRVDNEVLLDTIRGQAERASSVAEYWDTPFAYSNISARLLPRGRLALGFDVSWHVDLVTRQESAIAKDVLMHAILEPSPIGNRIKAMGLTPQMTDGRLREAVIFALTYDPNLAVRLKAFEVLTQYSYDGAVQEALLTTLKQDESVQLRFRALEFLAQQQVSSETLRRTIHEGGLESDTAIMQRAAELAQQL